MNNPITRRGFCLLGGASALLPGLSLAALADDSVSDSRAIAPITPRWDWLKNTFWYVPAPHLRAYLYTPSNQTLTYLVDQTVFHITGYLRGYFWGVTGTMFSGGEISYRSLVGSVTPEGQVYLSFTPFDPTVKTTISQGFGVMVRRLGQWTMANQMSTAPNAELAVFHWAYMVQTMPGRRSWRVLPGAGISVPEFLQNCPAGPTLAVPS